MARRINLANLAITDTSKVRFWSLVDCRSEDECWVFTGTKNFRGYGVFSHRAADGSATYALAHRLAWVISNPDESIGSKFILHSCDNPPCVNPAHLRPGTTAENMRDMALRGRGTRQSIQVCKHGHPYDEANTHWRTDRGYRGRDCRACRRDAFHRCKAKRIAAVSAAAPPHTSPSARPMPAKRPEFRGQKGSDRE